MSKKIFFIILSLGLVGICFLLIKGNEKEKNTRYKKMAYEAYQNDMYKDVVKYTEKRMKFLNSDDLINLGISYVFINKPEKAIPIFEKIIYEHPKASGLKYNLGYAYLMIGAVDKAEKEFRYIIEEKSSWRIDMELAYKGMALVCKKRGMFDEALEWVNKTIELCNKNKDNFNIIPPLLVKSSIYIEKGDYKLSRETLDQIMRIDEATRNIKTETSLMYYYYGYMFDKEGDMKKALINYKRFVSEYKRIDEELLCAKRRITEIQGE